MYNSQEVANVIKNLAKTKKITVGKMLSHCNLSINTLSSMQSGGYYPRLEAIAKIADYLDCSVDYLLGREDNPQRIGNTQSTVNTKALCSDEEQLLKNYNKLNTDGKDKVQEYTKDLTGNKAYTGTNSLQGKLHA